ncbi:MAG: hypothetical protein CMM84_03845 [Rhodothermaceae bacterium]|nr:hypothetical protein [Rhodothermaceae bacterium]MBC15350.1 hypothetical protein [Rhodothermaceae bacterium]
MPTLSCTDTAALVREHGPLTARQLADHLDCAQSTAAMRLDRAARMGLVDRRFAPEGSSSRYVFVAASDEPSA